MKAKFALVLVSMAILAALPCYALIKTDDGSVDLAIRYGLKMKGSNINDILGSNWVQDDNGVILNIYSPFIQIAIKSQNQNSTGNVEEDAKMVREKIKRDLSDIKQKNEIRFIISFYGDKPDFARDYSAYIVDADNQNAEKIKPKKKSVQKEAEKDNFNTDHPYSAVNCYIFRFDDISSLKNYYFVVASSDGKEIKYKLNNNNIY